MQCVWTVGLMPAVSLSQCTLRCGWTDQDHRSDSVGSILEWKTYRKKRRRSIQQCQHFKCVILKKKSAPEIYKHVKKLTAQPFVFKFYLTLLMCHFCKSASTLTMLVMPLVHLFKFTKQNSARDINFACLLYMYFGTYCKISQNACTLTFV